MSTHKRTSQLFLNDRRIVKFSPKLGAMIGINEAIVLQQIQYWLEINEDIGKNYRDGRTWTYNSYDAWEEQFQGCFSNSTIRRAIKKLEKLGLLITGNYNKLKMDKTKWYTIDYDVLDAMEEQKMSRPSAQNEQMRHINVPEQKNKKNAEKPRHDASAQNEQSICSNRANGTAQNEQSITIDYQRVTTESKDIKNSRKPDASDATDNFEIIWGGYPNKQGKQKARAAYLKAKKDGVTDADILAGIQNYIAYIAAKQVEPAYIKHGSTFFIGREWENEYDLTPKKTKVVARYNNTQPKQENLPGWAQEGQKPVVETPLSAEASQKLNERIKKLKSSGRSVEA